MVRGTVGAGVAARSAASARLTAAAAAASAAASCARSAAISAATNASCCLCASSIACSCAACSCAPYPVRSAAASARASATAASRSASAAAPASAAATSEGSAATSAVAKGRPEGPEGPGWRLHRRAAEGRADDLEACAPAAERPGWRRRPGKVERTCPRREGAAVHQRLRAMPRHHLEARAVAALLLHHGAVRARPGDRDGHAPAALDQLL